MKQPKILLFDIETKPVKAWVWRTGEQYVRHENIVNGEKFDIICIAYKWAGAKKVYCLDWGSEQDSTKMIDVFAKVVEQADVVLGQNSDSFDVKQVNTQRMLKGQSPIAWPVTEDLRKQVRKQFYLTSSSLEYMSNLLTGSGKDRMNFGDWIDIVEKKSSRALGKMKKYCKKDVLKLEAVWKHVRPFLKPKVNRSILTHDTKNGCPSCGNLELWRWGTYVSNSTQTKRWRCRKCGHTFHAKI